MQTQPRQDGGGTGRADTATPGSTHTFECPPPGEQTQAGRVLTQLLQEAPEGLQPQQAELLVRAPEGHLRPLPAVPPRPLHAVDCGCTRPSVWAPHPLPLPAPLLQRAGHVSRGAGKGDQAEIPLRTRDGRAPSALSLVCAHAEGAAPPPVKAYGFSILCHRRLGWRFLRGSASSTVMMSDTGTEQASAGTAQPQARA